MGSGTSSSTRGGTTAFGFPENAPPRAEKEPKNPHEKGAKTFARVYANDIAERDIYKEKPVFAVGSMIVREKLAAAEDTTPELVTVMIKRERDFSPKTGDWEYLVVDSTLAKITKREKKGSCSNCHANAENTDFVFKTYLK